MNTEIVPGCEAVYLPSGESVVVIDIVKLESQAKAIINGDVFISDNAIGMAWLLDKFVSAVTDCGVDALINHADSNRLMRIDGHETEAETDKIAEVVE